MSCGTKFEPTTHLQLHIILPGNPTATEMGQTIARPSTVAEKPTLKDIVVLRAPPVPLKVYRRRLMRYRLGFQIHIQSASRKRVSLSQKVDAAAKAEVLDPFTWRPYLESLMTDAMEADIRAKTGFDKTYLSKDVPCGHIRIHLEAVDMYKISGCYRGYVEWLSAACDMQEVGRAAAWHIGDRMAQYGLQNEEMEWWADLIPGHLQAILQKGAVVLEAV